MEQRMRFSMALFNLVVLGQASSSLLAADPPKPIRAGMIGLDTSHVVAFTKAFNDPKAAADLGGIKIVAAFPAGTDIAASKDRVKGFTEQVQGMGVEIVDSIPALLEKVDVVLLESVDGRPHLEQVLPVLKAGKPVFIDKPIAASLKDTLAIFAAAKEHNVPVFSSSSLRYYTGPQEAKSGKIGDIIGCTTYGPCSLEPTHPDLFWYGIHGVEALFTVMGTGCDTVTRVTTQDTDVVVGKWKDGRIGTYRGLRGGKAQFGGVAFGSKSILSFGAEGGGYRPLLVEVAKFFQTGKPPVSAEETIEIIAFMEAADESKRRGGVPVSIADVIAKAKEAK
jgi:hypothetical protein